MGADNHIAEMSMAWYQGKVKEIERDRDMWKDLYEKAVAVMIAEARVEHMDFDHDDLPDALAELSKAMNDHVEAREAAGLHPK